MKMTITVGWIRRNKSTSELLIASDSRLRSRGALDQAQKILRLERGDCCLGFSGDAQIAYPLFVQVGSTLNNYFGTRSRAADVTNLAQNIGAILNNLVGSWDLPTEEKREELATTRIMFAGWSWKHRRFDIGFFKYHDGSFSFFHDKAKTPHPWYEKSRSLVFIGDHRKEYMQTLASVLEERHGKTAKTSKKQIDFDYEPVEALQLLLTQNTAPNLPSIGGAAQLIKVYAHGNSLPIVIRTAKTAHYLFGRRLFEWEKTEYPVLDLTQKSSSILYPMSGVPLPKDLRKKWDPRTGDEIEELQPNMNEVQA
jgi:hypothetical protein